MILSVESCVEDWLWPKCNGPNCLQKQCILGCAGVEFIGNPVVLTNCKKVRTATTCEDGHLLCQKMWCCMHALTIVQLTPHHMVKASLMFHNQTALLFIGMRKFRRIWNACNICHWQQCTACWANSMWMADKTLEKEKTNRESLHEI